jgi:DNA-binding protein
VQRGIREISYRQSALTDLERFDRSLHDGNVFYAARIFVDLLRETLSEATLRQATEVVDGREYLNFSHPLLAGKRTLIMPFIIKNMRDQNDGWIANSDFKSISRAIDQFKITRAELVNGGVQISDIVSMISGFINGSDVNVDVYLLAANIASILSPSDIASGSIDLSKINIGIEMLRTQGFHEDAKKLALAFRISPAKPSGKAIKADFSSQRRETLLDNAA